MTALLGAVAGVKVPYARRLAEDLREHLTYVLVALAAHLLVDVVLGTLAQWAGRDRAESP